MTRSGHHHLRVTGQFLCQRPGLWLNTASKIYAINTVPRSLEREHCALYIQCIPTQSLEVDEVTTYCIPI